MSTTVAFTGACRQCGSIRAGGYYELPREQAAWERAIGSVVADGKKLRVYKRPPKAIRFGRHADGCPDAPRAKA